MKNAFILPLIFLAVVAAAYEPIAQTGFSRHPLTVGAARELANSLKRARDAYEDALKKARLEAAGAGNDIDLQRIDRALAGEAVTSFATPSANAAYKAFHARLLDADRLLLANLTSARNNARTQGDQENVKYLDELAAEMKRYIEMAGGEPTSARRSFKIAANKDFQDTGLSIPAGSQVSVSVSGSWAPGTVSRRRDMRSADADTYPLALLVGGQTFKCSRNEKFTARTGGNVQGRMASPAFNARAAADGRGGVLVTIEWSAPAQGVEANTVERALTALTVEEAVPAADGSVFTARIEAAKEWQSTGVTLKAGQKVEIEADGVWTFDVNNKKLLYRDADALNYGVSVGKMYHGPGGNKMIFLVRRDGELEVRPVFYAYAKKRELTPGGTLELKIKVTNP